MAARHLLPHTREPYRAFKLQMFDPIRQRFKGKVGKRYSLPSTLKRNQIGKGFGHDQIGQGFGQT